MNRETRRQGAGQAVAIFNRLGFGHAPFGFEKVPVSEHAGPVINLRAFESLAACVMNKCITGNP